MNWIGWAITLAVGAVGTALVNVLVREVEGWLDRLPDLVLHVVCLRVPRGRRREVYRLRAAELRDALAEREARPISRLLFATRTCLTFLRRPASAAIGACEVPAEDLASNSRTDLRIAYSGAVPLSDALAMLSSVTGMVKACAAAAAPGDSAMGGARLDTRALHVRLGPIQVG